MKRALLSLSTILCIVCVIAYVFMARTYHAVPDKTVSETSDSTIQVVASFYPLGEFARQVGGNLVQVAVIVPAGSEPHEYEPTPKDIASIYSSDILLVNGAGMDAWAMKLRPDLESKGVKVVVMSELLGFVDADEV